MTICQGKNFNKNGQKNAIGWALDNRKIIFSNIQFNKLINGDNVYKHTNKIKKGLYNIDIQEIKSSSLNFFWERIKNPN